jgi:hypothetical protein
MKPSLVAPTKLTGYANIGAGRGGGGIDKLPQFIATGSKEALAAAVQYVPDRPYYRVYKNRQSNFDILSRAN